MSGTGGDVVRSITLPAVLALLLLGAAACGEQDPRQQVLDERARWNAELLAFTQTEEAVQCRLRLTGPVNAALETLTVKVELIDADENPVQEVWEPIDVSGIRRGTPTEVYVRIPGPLPEVAAALALVVADPTPEQAAKIVELP